MVDCGEDEMGTASSTGGGSEDDAGPGVTSHESRDEDKDEETGDTGETKKKRMKM